MRSFIGRADSITQLRKILLGQAKGDGRLTVQSIEGPGGIGKISLFNHVVATTDISARNYLVLRLDGNEAAEKNLGGLVSRMVDSATASSIKGKPPGYYFPSVGRVVKAIGEIRAEVIAEVKKGNPDNKAAQEIIARYFDLILETGKAINDAVPATKKKVNFHEFEKARPILDAVMPRLDSVRSESLWLWEKLGLGGSGTLRNAIKANAFRPLADALTSDLSAILDGYKKEDRLKPTHKKVPGIDRLLLVIDDYEMLHSPIGEFLVGGLLPSLQSASFETTAIILGRDQLQNTHPAWDQHLGSCLQPSITVKPFIRREMDELIESFGINSAKEKACAWQDTLGYPFYVQLWIEEAEAGGRSAVMLKRFHDRTTRWMTDQQKGWLQEVLFIDCVDIASLKKALAQPEEAEMVFDWFKSEGSVRDTTGAEFRVREYLRSRLLDYLKITDPDRYDALKARNFDLGLMVA